MKRKNRVKILRIKGGQEKRKDKGYMNISRRKGNKRRKTREEEEAGTQGTH